MKLLNKKTLLVLGTLAASLVLATKADAASTVVMYRLYNPDNHEHFYTSSAKERDHLVKIKWGKYEGPAWDAPVETGNLVYRLYNKGLRDHHYTASWDEVKWLTNNYGWTYEGPAWRSAPKNDKPIYRLFLKGVTSGSHHYTASWDEVKWLTTSYGWKYEGVGWYGASKESQKVNKSALEALYTSVKDTKKGDFTDDTWNKFQSALTNAKNVLNNSKATQSQVDSAKNTLDSAYKGLKKKPAPSVNKSELQALYNKVKSTAKGDFTDATWNKFQSALTNANSVLNNSKATQSQVDSAKNTLNSAYKGLQHKPETPKDYTITINHVDAQTGQVVTKDQATAVSGSTYTAKAKAFKYSEGAKDNFSYKVIGSDTQSKKITANTTITFTYNQVHQISLLCNNNYKNEGRVDILKEQIVNVTHGENVTLTAPAVQGYVLDDRVEPTNSVTLNNITGSQNYIFNYTRKFNVTVNHRNVDTNAILSTETKAVYEGDNFSTPWKNMTANNYYICSNDESYVSVDSNGTRSINNINKNQTITFKYKNMSLDTLRESMQQKGLEWLNNYRQQNGVGAMQLNDIVQQAADIRAKEVRISFSHYRPGGGTFQDLLESLGCYGGKGENLSGGSKGYIDEFLSTDKAIDSLLGWKDSSGHNANLLYNNQSILGLGYDFSIEKDGTLYTPGVFISANPIFK
ncbi:CAP domain-containing protein [Enterococcus thailandicus]|uniref:CAP domain-containing protein n=1 Tax=Enterococcus thailandicus TaxID=417368 RepID=UPI0035E06940